MSKTYTVRKGARIPIQATFMYFWDGALTQGKVWDLSETGWRATMDQPLPAGTETTAYLALPDEGDPKYMTVDSATLCWSDGRMAGWKVERLDETASERLQQYLDFETEE